MQFSNIICKEKQCNAKLGEIQNVMNSKSQSSDEKLKQMYDKYVQQVQLKVDHWMNVIL